MEQRNIALRLSYTGTAYHGWQVQKNASSVAETLEKALSSVVCHPERAFSSVSAKIGRAHV